MTETLASKPAHVPEHLIYDFDMNAPRGADTDVHLAWKALHNDAPDIFWTPRNGGHWMATRAVDIEAMQLNHELFSHRRMQVPQQPFEVQPRMVPLELDPPEHTPFRALLSPEFGPKQVRRLEIDARTLINELIDSVYDQGECEFIASVASRFPVAMFLRLVELPLSDREELLEITEGFVRGRSAEERLQSQQALIAYVQKYIIERRTNPGDDLFSKMVNATVDGRPYTQEETFGMLMNVIFGGLDTVASAVGFSARYLADNPATQKKLVDDSSLIPVFVEEMLRRHGIPNTARVITQDTEYKGITFKENESIVLPKVLHGLDERRYPDPLKIKFDRGKADHAAFGAGPHRCAGAALGRMELRVFIEEWLKRIPEFEIAAGKRAVTSSGAVIGCVSLPLKWQPK